MVGHPRLPLRRIIFFGGMALGGVALYLTGQRFWEDSRRSCEFAQSLVSDARNILEESEILEREPFLEFVALNDVFEKRSGFQCDAAGGALKARFHFHLSEHAVSRVREFERQVLNHEPVATDEKLSLVRNLVSLSEKDLNCPMESGRAPAAESTVSSLHRDLLASWKGTKKEEAGRIEQQWNRDVATYCRSLSILGRLEKIRTAGSQEKKNTGAIKRIQLEIDQLEEIRKLNERKLRGKWGPKLYGKIHCS